MTKINLLPPEILDRQRARRRTALVAAAGLFVILLLGAFYVMQQITLSGVQDDLEQQRATNADLQAQVDELSRFDEIIAEISQKEDLLVTLLENEIHWSGVLRDLSLVIPGKAWLTTLNATVTDRLASSAGAAPPVAGTTGVAEQIIGSISFQGTADVHPTVAEWLTALEKIRGFLNPWISASANARVGTVPVVQFTSTVDLTADLTVEGREEA